MTGLDIALIIVSVLLIIIVLLQQRSVGLGGAFGGDSAVFTTRRGAEKSLYRLTILLGIALCVLVLWSAWVNRSSATTTNTNDVTAKVVDTNTTTDANATNQ